MALNECIPYFDDGDHITGYCTAAVGGKRFVKISGTRTGGKFDATAALAADRGAPNIAHADPGGRIHGVAAYDGAVGAFVDVVRGSKMVVPVVAGSALSAFQEVGVGLDGEAVPAGTESAATASLATGTAGAKNGITWTSKLPGEEGNNISVTLAAATGPHPAKSVAVSGLDITVYVTAGATTAAEVVAAVEGNADANDLVSVALTSDNDGSVATGAVGKTSLSGGTEGGSADQAVGYVLADCANGADAQVSLY